MSEDENDTEALRARADELEKKLQHILVTHRAQLLNAELRAEAIRAGMIDLDGLKLVDTGEMVVADDGRVDGAAEMMKGLRARKPWLFGERHSSSPGTPPPVRPAERKLATQMSYEEWRSARADLLKQR